jgi:molybdopterin-guanine dinucleotide biosynthesis protein A
MNAPTRATRAFPDLRVFVLAGGRSSRMGADKAFLELNGRTLLERAIEKGKMVMPSVCLVGPAEKFAAFGAVAEDVFPNRGPLGAIHAALCHTAFSFNLVLAVDLPFVDPAFLKFLVAEAVASGAVVTVPRAGGGFQPLCAVYHRRFRDVAQAALERGENKIDALFRSVETRILEPAELGPFALGATMFENLNTPQDLERAERRFAQQGS